MQKIKRLILIAIGTWVIGNLVIFIFGYLRYRHPFSLRGNLESIYIRSYAMEPTLNHNSYQMMAKLSDQEKNQLKRGDIVEYQITDNSYKYVSPGLYFGRIIALASDSVEIKDSTIYLNNQPLEEDYIKPDTTKRANKPKVTIASGNVLVVGDDRSMIPYSTYEIPMQSIVSKWIKCIENCEKYYP
jgi:signal peptidase I